MPRVLGLALVVALIASLTAATGASGVTVDPVQTTTSTRSNSVSISLGSPGQTLTATQAFGPAVTSPGNDPCPAGLASISIDWGDGTTSAPTPASPDGNGRIPVNGQHAYAAPGLYVATATSSDPNCRVVTITTSQQNIVVGGVVVAVNTNTNTDTHRHQFAIGDDRPTSCTPAAGPPQDVCTATRSTSNSLGHGYVGRLLTLDDAVLQTVHAATLLPSVISATSWSIAPCPGGLASVTIDWGDGTSSAPLPQAPQSNGAIPIAGNHTYTQAGDFPVTITSSDASCSIGSLRESPTGIPAAGPFTLINANLNVNVNRHVARIKSCGSMAVTANAISAQAASAFNGPVATFTRELSDPICPIAATPYTATIDWGDGQTSPATVSEDGGTFTVTGTHTYSAGGSFPVTVTARSDDGTSDSGQATANVAAAPVTNPPPGGSGVAGTAGTKCKKKKAKKKSAAAAKKSKGCKKKKKKR
jgi:hypothetical protein